MNIAAVSYHFGDKLGLYTEVLKRASGIDEQVKIREAMARSASPEKALRIFVRGMVEKICGEEEPDLRIKIMMQELANPTSCPFQCRGPDDSARNTNSFANWWPGYRRAAE